MLLSKTIFYLMKLMYVFLTEFIFYLFILLLSFTFEIKQCEDKCLQRTRSFEPFGIKDWLSLDN